MMEPCKTSIPRPEYEERKSREHFPTQMTALTLIRSPQNAAGATGRRRKGPPAPLLEGRRGEEVGLRGRMCHEESHTNGWAQVTIQN